GLMMVLCAQGGHWLYGHKKELLAGRFVQPFFAAPSRGWIFWPAAIICTLAAAYQTGNPSLRESAAQLPAAYFGSIALALIAWFWRQNVFFGGSGLILLLANTHLVRVLGGEFLRGHGLSELHLMCLGISLTLVQASVLRRLIRAEQPIAA